jgi:8-oxo-dGTP pyrophosphatase MutT (NUDIX family)
MEMASIHRLMENLPRTPGPDAKDAAVLILLFPEKGSVHTVLMQRPDYDGVHGGQISFPGGKREAYDNSLTETAIREANEEAGISREEISVINTLTPLFIPVSKIIVTPVLAFTMKKPVFRHHPEEVQFLFDVDFSALAGNSLVKTAPVVVRSLQIEVKHYHYENKIIWGATAMILRELLAIFERGKIPLIIK